MSHRITVTFSDEEYKHLLESRKHRLAEARFTPPDWAVPDRPLPPMSRIIRDAAMSWAWGTWAYSPGWSDAKIRTLTAEAYAAECAADVERARLRGGAVKPRMKRLKMARKLHLYWGKMWGAEEDTEAEAGMQQEGA